MLKKVKKENNIFLSDITPFSPEIFSAKKPHFMLNLSKTFFYHSEQLIQIVFFSLNTVTHLN